MAPTFGALKEPGDACGRSLLQIDECRYGAFVCAIKKVNVCPGPRAPDGARCTSSASCDGSSLCVEGICQPLTTFACKAHARIE